MSDPAVRAADWLGVDAAVGHILASVPRLGAETVPVSRAAGRVLAEDIISPIDHPPWDNSGMDGFAVRALDVRGASLEAPVELRVIETVPAGGFAAKTVGAGEAIRIMTGAPVPQGADGVIRVEHTKPAGDALVQIVDDMDAGRNVRPRGEDIRAGERVLASGRRLRASEIGVLASIGCAQVPVIRRPHVAILATGDELVDLDEFEAVRAGHRIINSNTYALAAAVQSAGGEPLDLGIARDDIADVRMRIQPALNADVLVTTAGASVGDHDVVKDALEQEGLVLAFWRVTMRPGSPVSFGLLPRAERPPLPVFGLPGNPVSAVVTFEVLVRPALRHMQHRRDVYGRTVRVRAAQRMSSTPKLTHFLRVTLDDDGDGVPLARLTGPQGSGMLTSVARADALVVVPLGMSVVEEGEEATALLLPAPDEGQLRAGYTTGA